MSEEPAGSRTGTFDLGRSDDRPDYNFYLKELGSDQCQCGKSKKPGKSLCWHCYRALPKEMQRDLYLPLREGYVDAYEAAVKWLEG